MKLQLFGNLEWKAIWIDNAREKFTRVIQKRYAKLITPALSTISDEFELLAPPRVTSNVRTSETPQNTRQFDELVFGTGDDELEENQTESQIDIYIREARVGRNMDIIQWWKLHEHRLPNLALMARDYLSVPATRYSTHF